MYVYLHIHTQVQKERERPILTKKNPNIFSLKTENEVTTPSHPFSLIHKSASSNSEGCLNPIKFFMLFNCVSRKKKKYRVEKKKTEKEDCGIFGGFFV